MILINIIFLIVTAIVFLIALIFLLNDRGRYLNEVKSKQRYFIELSRSEKTPIDKLEPTCKALALEICAVKNERERSYISFRDGRVELLRYPSQVVEDFSTASLKSIPAILTTIGILGTFVGITNGLYALNDFGSNSSELVKQASGLIGGLGTAFITSIAGMGASFVFMIIFSWCVSNTKKAKDNLIDQIQKNSVVVTSNDLLHQLVASQRNKEQQSVDFNKLVTTLDILANKPNAITANEYEHFSKTSVSDICTSLTSMEKSINTRLSESKMDEQLLAKALSKDLSVSLDRAFQTPNNLLNDICEEIKQINQATFSLTEMLESLVTSNDNKLSLLDIEGLVEQKVFKPINC
jgi:hypothetical protein